MKRQQRGDVDVLPTTTTLNRSKILNENAAVQLIRFCASSPPRTINEKDSDNSSRCAILLKDIIVGLLSATGFVFLLLLLDYSIIAPSWASSSAGRTAHRITTAITIDPEILTEIEEATGQIFVPMDWYDEVHAEIRLAHTIIEEEMLEFIKKNKEMVIALNDRLEVKPEHEKLSKYLELETYCGSCRWKGRTTCDERLHHVQKTYGDGEARGRILIIQNFPQCKNTT